jgi:hypothetical protein
MEFVTGSPAPSPDGLDRERLVRAVSHGIANRLLVIRCHAELAASDHGRGNDPTEELLQLVAATNELGSVSRELAGAATHLASTGDREAFALLSLSVSRLFPDELALEAEVRPS